VLPAEQRADLVPDPRGLDEAAEQDDGGQERDVLREGGRRPTRLPSSTRPWTTSSM